jgi:5-methylcytosine-specific restriction enzyme A
MPLLYYWRPDNYQRDLAFGVGYHLNQDSPRLHEIDIGDSLWAFTRRADGACVLAAEIVVRARTLNRNGFHYGRYRLWGDLQKSRYFLVPGQPQVDAVLRALSLDVRARFIPQAFQGHAAVRRIDARDHAMLAAAASGLPLEPRAHLVPEERLEALVLLGDPEGVRHLLAAEAPGLAGQRQAYLYGTSVSRVRAWTDWLRDRYDDRCQLCGWSGKSSYQRLICEAHHLQWLSRGGADELDNLVLVCPNHHRVIHAWDAAFDFGDHSFVFSELRREALREPGHLVA